MRTIITLIFLLSVLFTFNLNAQDVNKVKKVSTTKDTVKVKKKTVSKDTLKVKTDSIKKVVKDTTKSKQRFDIDDDFGDKSQQDLFKRKRSYKSNVKTYKKYYDSKSFRKYKRETNKKIRKAKKEIRKRSRKGKVSGGLVKVFDEDDRTTVNVGNIEVDVDNNSGDTKIRFGKKRLNVVNEGNDSRVFFDDVRFDGKTKSWGKRKFDGHWAGFELGFIDWYKEDYDNYKGGIYKGNFDLRVEKSSTVNLNLYEYNIPFTTGRNRVNLGLITGVGFMWENYRFDKEFTVQKDDNGDIIFTPLKDLGYKSIKKSKLTAWYVTVPLILEFQVNRGLSHRQFFISAGMVGAFRINSHTKIKHSGGKDKEWDNFNLRTFKYFATARIGYGPLNFFANYHLQSLFEEDEGPELFPISVGFSIPF